MSQGYQAMTKPTLADLAKEKYAQGQRLVAPLLGFPGVTLAETEIKLAQQNYSEHFRVIRALVETFQPDLIFPLMDLSIEANALGRYTLFPRNESATVPRDHFDFEEIEALGRIDLACDSRIMGYVETVKRMKKELPDTLIKGAYVIGPYSLAGLLISAEEAAVRTLTHPGEMHRLCGFTRGVIQQYADLLIEAGAELICILEPSAVMLGPKQFTLYSAAHVQTLAARFKEQGVYTVYHICGNSMHLIQPMVNSGVDGMSLDAREYGVDLLKVLQTVPGRVAVIGNISPTGKMLLGTPDEVRMEVRDFLERMTPYPHLILSTGCDLPRETPLENIRAFMETGRNFRMN